MNKWFDYDDLVIVVVFLILLSLGMAGCLWTGTPPPVPRHTTQLCPDLTLDC